jgi:predicted RNA-binding Zn ribbon-like protein
MEEDKSSENSQVEQLIEVPLNETPSPDAPTSLESIPENTPENNPKDTSENTPENTPEDTPENTPEESASSEEPGSPGESVGEEAPLIEATHSGEEKGEDEVEGEDEEASSSINPVVLLAETTYRLVRARLGELIVNPRNLLTVLKNIMEVVEGSIARGEERKELAVTLIKRLVQEAGMDSHNLELCMSLIDEGIVGATIDLIVDATKGDLNINAVEETAANCCLAFLNRRQRRRRAREH